MLTAFAKWRRTTDRQTDAGAGAGAAACIQSGSEAEENVSVSTEQRHGEESRSGRLVARRIRIGLASPGSELDSEWEGSQGETIVAADGMRHASTLGTRKKEGLAQC